MSVNILYCAGEQDSRPTGSRRLTQVSRNYSKLRSRPDQPGTAAALTKLKETEEQVKTAEENKELAEENLD